MSADSIRGLAFGVLMLHGLGHGLPAPPPSRAPSGSHHWSDFVVVALSFWGVLGLGEAWRTLAVASSIVSPLGIALFFGTWPPFNTIAAVAVDVAVLAAVVWLNWPPPAVR